MKTIFSHQSFSPQGNDIIIIDGVLSEYVGTTEQAAAASNLHPKNGMTCCSMLNVVHSNKDCNIYLGKKDEILVISNLQTRDNSGRHISYSFFCDDSNNKEEVLSALDRCCQLANVTMTEIDKRCIREALFLRKNRAYVYGGLAVLAFILCKAIF